MSRQACYYIGLMSGTSLDGIDGVLASFSEGKANVHRHADICYPAPLKRAFIRLLTSGENEIEHCISAKFQRNSLACQLVENLCEGFDRSRIAAIADHGQTIRHFPQASPPYSVQLHDGPGLSVSTGLDSVVDFRSQDIAAGGQGAPLVPAFHRAFFGHPDLHRVIVNIGGIANISVLPPAGGPAPAGFDTGPGNTLLDGWCRTHTGRDYDNRGQWGASGKINDALLAILLDDPYFQLAPPKSTGREYFNQAWLERRLQQAGGLNYPREDIQASLAALTAHSIVLGIRQACDRIGLAPDAGLEGIYLCGGGVNNTYLFDLLTRLAPVPVHSTERLGVPPQQVEATAFAWLGREALNRNPVDLYRTTGARHNNILGAVYRSSA